MRAFAIGLVAGACWLQTSAALPPLWTACLLLVSALLLLSGLSRLATLHALLPALACVVAGVLIGHAWSAVLAQQRLSAALPLELEGQDLALTGVVASLPQHFEGGVRFHFEVESPQQLPPRVALSWYARDSTQPVLPMVRPGQRWQFKVRLRRPHGNANPFGFDYEAWLLEQGVRATGYVRAANADENRLLDEFVPGPGALVERWRDRLRERMQQALQDMRYAPVLVALVIGDQRDISRGDD